MKAGINFSNFDLFHALYEKILEEAKCQYENLIVASGLTANDGNQDHEFIPEATIYDFLGVALIIGLGDK